MLSKYVFHGKLSALTLPFLVISFISTTSLVGRAAGGKQATPTSPRVQVPQWDESFNQLIYDVLATAQKDRANVNISFEGTVTPLNVQHFEALIQIPMETQKPVQTVLPIFADGTAANVSAKLITRLDVNRRILQAKISPKFPGTGNVQDFVGEIRFREIRGDSKMGAKKLVSGALGFVVETPQIELLDLSIESLSIEIHLPQGLNPPTSKSDFLRVFANCQAKSKSRDVLTGDSEMADLEKCEFELKPEGFYVNFRQKPPQGF